MSQKLNRISIIQLFAAVTYQKKMGGSKKSKSTPVTIFLHELKTSITRKMEKTATTVVTSHQVTENQTLFVSEPQTRVLSR